MVHTCRPTNLPARRIDQVFEEHHYEVTNDNWRVKNRRTSVPRWRLVQQQIKDARSQTY